MLLAGCRPSGPASIWAKSTAYPTLAERVAVLNRYVTFRRAYASLDFDLMVQNNDGLMPGPSDYDVRLVATVPAVELSAWVPAGPPTAKPDVGWLSAVPTSLDLSGVTEWHDGGGRVVGLDRQRRVVVYRAWSR